MVVVVAAGCSCCVVVVVVIVVVVAAGCCSHICQSLQAMLVAAAIVGDSHFVVPVGGGDYSFVA